MRALVSRGTISLVTLLAVSPLFAHSFVIEDLRITTGANFVNPEAINNAGDIIGFFSINSYDGKAIFHNGSISPLTALPPGPLQYGNLSELNINDQAVDASTTQTDPFTMSSLLVDTKTGANTDIGKLNGFPVMWGLAINDAGTIVGYGYEQSSSTYHNVAFIWKNGLLTQLPNFPGVVDTMPPSYDDVSAAYDINSHGDIVGYALGANGRLPVLWRNGLPTMLPDFQGLRYIPSKINDNSQILLEVFPPGKKDLYLLQNSDFVAIGNLAGQTTISETCLNNIGWVIGRTYSSDSPAVEKPFLWKNGKINDLNDLIPAGSGWVLQDALALNDSGVILGSGFLNGQYRTYLMKPIAAPAPQAAGLTPDRAAPGSSDVTLTITGTNFDNDSFVSLNGVAQPSSQYVSATQMTVTVPAALMAHVGIVAVKVVTPAPGGGSSGALYFNVAAPRAAITSVTPDRVDPGAANVKLTFTGTNFDPGAVVTINDSYTVTPTVLSSSKLTVALPQNIANTSGSYFARVVNPGWNNASAPVRFLVAKAPPVIASLNPNRIPAGLASFSLYVYGAGFTGASQVSFNGGAPVTPTSILPGRIVVPVPSALLAASGNIPVRVVNSFADGGTSAPSVLSIAARPILTSITPNKVPASGAGEVTITFTGAHFEPGSVVTINDNITVTPTVLSATKLTAVLPTGVASVAGAYFVRVVNPGYANFSNPQRLTVSAAP